MKKLFWLLFLFPTTLGIAHGDTTTNRMGLTIPTIGSPTWGSKVNTNFQIIDAFSGVANTTNTFTSSNTFSGYTTFDSTVVWHNLQNGSGVCLGLNTSSQTIIVPCGTGGGGVPGGSDTQVQYNKAGAFAGNPIMFFDGFSLNLASDLGTNIGNSNLNLISTTTTNGGIVTGNILCLPLELESNVFGSDSPAIYGMICSSATNSSSSRTGDLIFYGARSGGVVEIGRFIGTLNTFKLGNTLTFPDNSVQTTAFTGTGGGIVSPGTFTWINNFGISVSTLVVSSSMTLSGSRLVNNIAPVNGQVLTWNSGNNWWMPSPVPTDIFSATATANFPFGAVFSTSTFQSTTTFMGPVIATNTVTFLNGFIDKSSTTFQGPITATGTFSFTSTGTFNAKISVRDNTGFAFTAIGTGNGGSVTAGSLAWKDFSTSNTLGVLSDIGNGITGAFYLLGDHLSAPFGEMGEFDIMDRQLIPADARIALTVGRIDSGGGYRYDVGIRTSGGSIVIPFGVTPTGVVIGGTVDGLEPSAFLHILASGGSAGSTPFKIDSGTLVATPESGSFERSSAGLFFDNSSSQRDKFAFTTSTQVWTSSQTFLNGVDIKGQLTSNGQLIGLIVSTYATSGVYNFTTATATIAVGTSSSTITLTSSGTYLLTGNVNLRYNGSTFIANQFVTLNFYRQNNTPSVIANTQDQEETAIITTITNQFIKVGMNSVQYTTTNTNDVLSLQGSITATPSAGNFQATGAAIIAQRLF